MKTFEVRTIEEIRYIKSYTVEAETREEARQIVLDEEIEGKDISDDCTYFDIITINEL